MRLEENVQSTGGGTGGDKELKTFRRCRGDMRLNEKFVTCDSDMRGNEDLEFLGENTLENVRLPGNVLKHRGGTGGNEDLKMLRVVSFWGDMRGKEDLMFVRENSWGDRGVKRKNFSVESDKPPNFEMLQVQKVRKKEKSEEKEEKEQERNGKTRTNKNSVISVSSPKKRFEAPGKTPKKTFPTGEIEKRKSLTKKKDKNVEEKKKLKINLIVNYFEDLNGGKMEERNLEEPSLSLNSNSNLFPAKLKKPKLGSLELKPKLNSELKISGIKKMED